MHVSKNNMLPYGLSSATVTRKKNDDQDKSTKSSTRNNQLHEAEDEKEDHVNFHCQSPPLFDLLTKNMMDEKLPHPKELLKRTRKNKSKSKKIAEPGYQRQKVTTCQCQGSRSQNCSSCIFMDLQKKYVNMRNKIENIHKEETTLASDQFPHDWYGVATKSRAKTSSTASKTDASIDPDVLALLEGYGTKNVKPNEVNYANSMAFGQLHLLGKQLSFFEPDTDMLPQKYFYKETLNED